MVSLIVRLDTTVDERHTGEAVRCEATKKEMAEWQLSNSLHSCHL